MGGTGASPFGAGGMPDLSALLGGAGAGGMPDLSALMEEAGASGMPDLSSLLGGAGGLNIMEMMSNPMVQGMMQQMMQNPETLRQMIQSNPILRSMAQNNPMMRQMFENPEVMQMAMRPEVLQQSIEMMRSNQPIIHSKLGLVSFKNNRWKHRFELDDGRIWRRRSH